MQFPSTTSFSKTRLLILQARLIGVGRDAVCDWKSGPANREEKFALRVETLTSTLAISGAAQAEIAEPFIGIGGRMTYSAEINRCYATRHDAWGYLASRGFLSMPAGWRNGRWLATVERDVCGFKVRVWLPIQEAA